MGYLTAFIGAALVPLGLLVSLGAHLGNVSGGLTRLGRLSERDFGHVEPPTAEPLRLRGVDAAAPEVIVLGDSFSLGNIWQSQWMTWRGRNDVVTYTWDDIGGPGCLIDWVGSLRQRYPTAKHLVIETIERTLSHRLLSMRIGCDLKPGSTVPVVTAEGWQTEARSTIFWPPPDARYALAAWRAERKSFAERVVRDQVVATPLARRDLFSNHRSDVLLTFIDDELKRAWKPADLTGPLQRLQQLQRGLSGQGIQLTMLVIPDKSTAYAAYIKRPQDVIQPSADAWDLLSRAGVRQVAIKPLLLAALPGTVDLYLPNDTHLSLVGYRLLAGAVRDAVSP